MNGNEVGSGRAAPIPTPPHLLKTILIPAPPRLTFFFKKKENYLITLK